MSRYQEKHRSNNIYVSKSRKNHSLVFSKNPYLAAEKTHDGFNKDSPTNAFPKKLFITAVL